MKYEVYKDLSVSGDLSVVDFVSNGRKGSITKRIVFHATEWSNVYNLAFGDLENNGEINDYNISDNGDRNKVLATVVSVVKDYTQKYPERIIFFRGSTMERTRLYRIAITLNYTELAGQFDIYVYADDTIQPFSVHAEAEGFLVKRKTS